MIPIDETEWPAVAAANLRDMPYRKAWSWQRTRNILAFPYGWQRPAKTEEWAYERALATLEDNRFTQMVCFPWATLIDLQRNQHDSKAQPYLEALVAAPPKSTLIRATVCQHIWVMDMLVWFKRLGITDLYWPHATTTELERDGIRIHPFPLYPVACAEHLDLYALAQDPDHERPYLYSFIGAYQPGLYLSPVRQWIFDLPLRPDARVERRGEWHFEQAVYGEQIGERSVSERRAILLCQQSREYAEVLSKSVFSLCPSGSGPNSIRLWESIGFGCIPILLSNGVRLPGSDCDWNDAVIHLPEDEASLLGLPETLQEIAQNAAHIKRMRLRCRQLWETYNPDCLRIHLSAFPAAKKG